MADHLLAARHVDRRNVLTLDPVRRFQLQHRGHWHMRGDVAGITLHHRLHGVPGAAKARRQARRINLVAEHLEETKLAFEHLVRAGEAVARKRRRHHATLGRAPQMQTLDHATAGF